MTTLQDILKPQVKTKKKAPASAAANNLQVPISLEELYRKVQQKAYELYEKRGCSLGYECQDWLEAERLIEAESKKGPAKQ